MGKRKVASAGHLTGRRVACGACGKKLAVARAMYRYFAKPTMLGPKGDMMRIVCDEKCERRLYDAARLLNWLMHGEAVAYESNAVLRHDRYMREGATLRKKDGEAVIEYGAGPDPRIERKAQP